MKHKIRWTIIGIFWLVAYACSKNKGNFGLPNTSAALTIVNLINGSNGVFTNFTPTSAKGISDSLQYYSTAAEIYYGSFEEFSAYSGNQVLVIASSTDTLTSAWSGVLSLPIGSITSIYFAGPDTLHVDTLLIQDNIPHFPEGDSVVGVRFINLAAQSNPVLVDIQGDTTTPPLAASLSYKGATGFLTLPATSASPSSSVYVFEFRDAVSDSLLSTYTYSSFYLSKSVTIALGGLGGSNNPNYNTYMVYDF
jgi:hypothetical protein